MLIREQVFVGQRHVWTGDAGSRAAETAYFEDGVPMTIRQFLILLAIMWGIWCRLGRRSIALHCMARILAKVVFWRLLEYGGFF
jgi:hypothetical protein